jgi:adenine specific DNA methylase Mod
MTHTTFFARWREGINFDIIFTILTHLISHKHIKHSPANGVVLDPFFGSGTTGVVASKNGRKYIGLELNS